MNFVEKKTVLVEKEKCSLNLCPSNNLKDADNIFFFSLVQKYCWVHFGRRVRGGGDDYLLKESFLGNLPPLTSYLHHKVIQDIVILLSNAPCIRHGG